MNSVAHDAQVGNPQVDIKKFHRLAAHLHRGGPWAHYWRAADHQSLWFPAGTVPELPAVWRTEHNVYFTVNPVSEARKRSAFTASTNETVAAINTLFAEYDGKDFIRQDEWLPHYQTPELAEVERTTRAKLAHKGLAETQLVRRVAGAQRGALQKAQTAAIDAAYKRDPDGYKARAWAHIQALAVRPSAVVASGGGFQCYWLLRDTVPVTDANRKEIAHTQREWVHLMGGDRSACDLRRVLRVPGSHNVKARYAPDYPLVTFEWCELNRLYDYADLAARVPHARTPVKRAHTYTPKHVDLPEVDEVPELPAVPEVAIFNRKTDLRELLLDYGYSEHTGGRLSRPGGDSGGVEMLKRNRARIYSTADPLYCDRPVTPADALCIYEFGGDGAATVAHLQALYAERLAALKDYRRWLASPSAIAELKAAGFKNPERARKLLDAILQRCEIEAGPRIAPGYAYLAKATGISQGGLSAYLSRLFAADLIDLLPGRAAEPGAPAEPTAIELVFHNLNASGSVGWESVQVVKNWNVYREFRADEVFLNNHAVYARTHLQPALQPFGDNGLGALLALLDGPTTIQDAAELIGYSYGAMARTMRRYAARGVVAVTHGERNRKTYTIKDEWRAIIDADRPHMPTYGVLLFRHVEMLKNRVRLLRKRGLGERADAVEKEYKRLDDKAHNLRESASIIGFDWPASKREKKIEHLKHAHRIARQILEQKPKPTTEADRWRRKEYAKARAEVEANWPDFAAWAEATHGPGWWTRLDQTAVIGQYKVYQVAGDTVPSIRWAGAEVAA